MFGKTERPVGIAHITQIMKHSKIKCHGHQCPDKIKCPLYTFERIDGDNEEGDNSIDCEIKKYYADTIKA